MFNMKCLWKSRLFPLKAFNNKHCYVLMNKNSNHKNNSNNRSNCYHLLHAYHGPGTMLHFHEWSYWQHSLHIDSAKIGFVPSICSHHRPSHIDIQLVYPRGCSDINLVIQIENRKTWEFCYSGDYENPLCVFIYPLNVFCSAISANSD